MSGVRCMLMRGGTSKGAYFVADDLPTEAAARDRLLLEVMGSPDPRQIDGIGGAHPLTSKVAVVGRSDDGDVDVDYLFLQVGVDTSLVSDQQNCGNLLAGVGPFAIERGLVGAEGDRCAVRIRMVNTGEVATAHLQVRNGAPVYGGGCEIAGVPGTAAPIELEFSPASGSGRRSVLPTGRVSDIVEGVEVVCVDNGMPVVVMLAADMGVTGHESCAELEANASLRQRVEAVRLAAGGLMGLGDVTAKTVPKMTLVSSPAEGGTICTRTFIPHRCHDAIGVLGAISVATAVLVPGSPAASVASNCSEPGRVTIEHPTGSLDAMVTLATDNGGVVAVRSSILRTTRKLMDGLVFPRTDLGRPDPRVRSLDAS